MFGFFRRGKKKKATDHEIERLMVDLKDLDGDVRAAAGDSLGEMPAEAVPTLIPALMDPHSGVRAGVAFALGKIGDASAVEPVIRTLQDENADVRAMAAAALGRLRDPRAIPALTRALSDPDNGVRFLSIGSLNSIGGKQVVPALIKAVKDEDKENKMTAIACLAKMNDVQAVEPLIEALKDQEKEVRTIAIVGLVELGDTRAVEPLIQVLTGGPEHQEVLEQAVLALGEIGDLRAVAPLLAALRTKYPNLRAVAAQALGKRLDPSAVEPLIQGLQDENASVRFYSAQALGEIGDERVVHPLSQVLEDPNEDVRKVAREALAKLGLTTTEVIQARSEAHRVELGPEAAPLAGGKPTFLGKEERGRFTYEKYKATDAETAKAFLLKKKVDRPGYYVTVETTDEGTWGMDKEGLYLVHLLDWQKDLRLGDCEGDIDIFEAPPQELSLGFAATDRADNFIAKVICGKCEHEWFDGLRYQNTTIVRCPKCKALNKVDSTGIHYLSPETKA